MRRAVVAAVLAGCGSSPPVVPPDAAEPDALMIDAAPVPQLVLDPIATGIVDPTVLAIDASDVYFVHAADSISRVGKSGGAVAPIAMAQNGPGSLDATSENLVWACTGSHANDFLDGSIRWLPKAGGTETELAVATLPSAVAVDFGGTTVFWTEVDGQRVQQIQIDGTGALTIDATATHKTSLAITPSRLAWTASGDSADVVTIDRPLVMKLTLSTVEYSPGSIVLDGDDVFWTERHPGSDLGAIRVARGGGLAADLVADEYAPTALVRDDRYLYWASNGRIRRIARAGGTAVTISEGRGTIGALAVDATHLYWTETTHGAIVRAIK